MTQLGICYIVIVALAIIAVVGIALFIATARDYSRYRKETEPLLDAMTKRWAESTGSKMEE